ncbi:MAG: hypothetical protein K0R94_139 [Burkholderiales bacterium]|jgi:hypothetical protein|nr:hypothetical protein [Burkholderiales bacterium]
MKINNLIIIVAALGFFISTAIARPFDITKDTKMRCEIKEAMVESLSGEDLSVDSLKDKVWLEYVKTKNNTHIFSTSFGNIEVNPTDGTNNPYNAVYFLPSTKDIHNILSIHGHTNPQYISTLTSPQKEIIRDRLNNNLHPKWIIPFTFDYNQNTNEWSISGLFIDKDMKTPLAYLTASKVKCHIQ